MNEWEVLQALIDGKKVRAKIWVDGHCYVRKGDLVVSDLNWSTWSVREAVARILRHCPDVEVLDETE